MGLVLFSTAMIFGQDWKGRESWPDDFPRPPKTKKQLFYLQRNVNSNTIAYDLNLQENGVVNTREPLDVYWMRYTGERNGVREELSWAQEMFAFGYSADTKSKEEFEIKLTAYKARKVNVKKINGQWAAIMSINGRECQLSNIYVYADESGIVPDVQHVDLYGKDLATEQAVHERFFNN